MARIFLMVGSLLAFLGVALGAFAAHFLKNFLSPVMLETFEVGVRYQMIHAFGIFVVAWACSYWNSEAFAPAGWLFLFGIILFSGSLYGLSLGGMKWLGAITPIGGLLFLCGWVYVFWTAWRMQ